MSTVVKGKQKEMITVWVTGKRDLKAKLALQGKSITVWIQETIDRYLGKGKD